jgi:hypothetical protein
MMLPVPRSTFFATAAAGCALLCACGSSGSVPNQVLTKPTPASAPAPVARTSGSWAYRPSMQRQLFVIDQKATVAIRSDTATYADTISSHAEISFTLAEAPGAASGTVGAFLVQGSGHAAATPAGLVTPFPFRGEYSARGTQIDFTIPREVSPCSSSALAVAQSMRDLWFRAPDTLRVGVTWEDSASYVACRDGVPMRTTAHRSFRITSVEEKDGHALLTLTRTSRSAIDGAGSQFGEPVTVNGSGTGQLVYTLDAGSGEIISASGSATLDLSLRSRLRTQAVHQAAEIHISRR